MSYAKIDVLDHGFVRLVSYMQPVPIEVDTPAGEALAQPPLWTGDLEIVRNARVSFDADWRTGDNEYNDERLIGTLMRNRHTSPFEAMAFTFEVKCPIFIARQWHRHRTWKYNEVSARYAELPEEFYVPRPEVIGTQSKSNKQARDLSADWSEENAFNADVIRASCEKVFRTYKSLLNRGVPRELARSVLPLATYTRYFGTVDLHNLLHFISLRIHPHAQWEMQQYGLALLELVRPIVPVSIAAWEKRREADEAMAELLAAAQEVVEAQGPSLMTRLRAAVLRALGR